MKSFRAALLASGILLAAACASSASAASLLKVDNVAVVGGLQQLNISGHGNENAAGILFHAATDSDIFAGDTLLVFCDDIFHNVYLGGHNPTLDYELLPVDTNSATDTGNPITAWQSYRMGKLAEMGRDLYLLGDTDDNDVASDLVAIQGAIWWIEYGDGVANFVTSSDSEINSEMAAYIAAVNALTQPSTPTYAQGFRSVNGDGHIVSQGQVLGVPIDVQGGVPEPATWAMMLTGFFGLGALLRGRRTVLARA